MSSELWTAHFRSVNWAISGSRTSIASSAHGVKVVPAAERDVSCGPIYTSPDSAATWTPVKQTHSDPSAFGSNQWPLAQNPFHANVGKASGHSQLIENLLTSYFSNFRAAEHSWPEGFLTAMQSACMVFAPAQPVGNWRKQRGTGG